MAARFTVLLPRLLALTVIWLLGAATFTLAAEKKPAATAPAPAAKPARPHLLTVPDVRGKAYVFAKGILQDGGFAWRVRGSVQGYAANLVVAQYPAPGFRVVDNGAPTVQVRLFKNERYAQSGLPENESPYAGTRIMTLSEWNRRHAQPQEEPTTTAATTSTTATTTEESKPAPPPKPAKTRKPDFAVAGAPAEPSDEIPLPDRARRLARRVDAASKPTRRLVDFWLYQHAWIVTGARFGWHNGAEALRVLIKVDQTLERRWDFGARSERVARSALAYAEAQAR